MLPPWWAQAARCCRCLVVVVKVPCRTPGTQETAARKHAFFSCARRSTTTDRKPEAAPEGQPQPGGSDLAVIDTVPSVVLSSFLFSSFFFVVPRFFFGSVPDQVAEWSRLSAYVRAARNTSPYEPPSPLPPK